jgi:hypothetical protein
MVLGIDLALGTGGGGGGGVSTTFQPRHNRYEIVSTPASTGTIALASNVALCEGYEAYAEVLEYSETFGILGPVFVTTDPFPLPCNISINPETAVWNLIDPRDGQPFTPLTAIAIVYRCKIPLENWDESAPLYR